jgi:dihydroorotate dehydrogenase electron transfer subunit
MIDQSVEISFNKKINSGTFLMGFRSPQLAFESRPGQFIMVRIDERFDPLLRRPISICGVFEEETVCILVKVVGHGTEILEGKKAGEKISVLGPLGQGFSLPDEDERAVLVAGGIGIAPLNFFARSIKNNPIKFMAGFASSKAMIPLIEINRRALDVSIATDDGSEGYSGMVTGLLESYLDEQINKSEKISIYACGPLPMLKKTTSIASERAIGCQVSLESLMACGLGACQGCAVKKSAQDNATHYLHVCKDGPVFSSNTIDWSII